MARINSTSAGRYVIDKIGTREKRSKDLMEF